MLIEESVVSEYTWQQSLHLIDKVEYVKLFATFLQKEAAGSNHS